jgi:DNA-binding NarL/FixJ family response regulator
LVGREDELAELETTLRVRSVVVVAPAGVGKSRLAREAVAVQEREGALTGWVQATRSAAAIPLGAFAELLPDDVRADETAQLLRRSAEALRERAGRRPIVIGVDDAQLLDPVSAALVLHLARQDVRVLATARSGEPLPDAIEALTKDADALRVELGLLADAAVAKLVEAALGAPVEEAAVRWVSDTGRGNPLYVRELIAGALDAGSLAAADGLWRLRGRPAVNDSLSELIARRLADLPAEQRASVELLSLSEPLWPEELVMLSSEDALLDAEAGGLIMMDPGGHVRLSHPLFGEVVGGGLGNLRARQLRLRLAETLQRRDPLTSDDALRIARLLLDAGAEIPRALLLDAARAANLAGDPGLGAQLAELALDEDGLDAALLLARAHTLRNRDEDAEAVLAAAEARAPGTPQAVEYLRQRTWILTWGLHRSRDTVALLDRALTWSDDPRWLQQMMLMRQIEAASLEGFSAVDALEAALADPALPADERLLLESFAALSALYSGDGKAAVETARRLDPSVPHRSLGDTVAFLTSQLVMLETGSDWPALEASMAQTLGTAVRAGDHAAAGGASWALGVLHFMRGRYRDAARWFAEAQLHYGEHDVVGAVVPVHAFQVGVAAVTGDFDGAAVALDRIDSVLHGRVPLPNQLPYILRARGWAARLRSDTDAVELMLDGAAQVDRTPVFGAALVYEALRAGAGAAVAPRLRALANRCRADLVAAYAAHADARAAGDGAALLTAAESFATIGASRYAMEAAAEAAAAFLQEGRRDSAHRAASRTLELHAPGQGTEPPVIDGLAAAAIELTRREEQIVDLARRGLSNVEIADRLVLSVRTVENHLYHAMYKLGVNDRRRL